jgi:hypothetical protein
MSHTSTGVAIREDLPVIVERYRQAATDNRQELSDPQAEQAVAPIPTTPDSSIYIYMMRHERDMTGASASVMMHHPAHNGVQPGILDNVVAVPHWPRRGTGGV